MRTTWIALAGAVVTTGFLAGTAPAADPHSHEGEITAYEGAKTCLECHDKAGQEVAASLHYQQQGPAPFLEGQPAGKPAGMMVSF
jgi:hypothetical protein